jgi:hypothetical protein
MIILYVIASWLLMTFFAKKLFVILNDSEGSIIRHASSPCKACE